MGRITIDPERELAELREYLGDDYDHARLQRYEQAVDEELAEVGDEATLYRTSQMYLYNLTAFAMSRTKEAYLRDLTDLVPTGRRILDYGCGIGSDGLLLLEAGYDVGFADFANPSTEYLHRRLERRGLEAPVYDLDTAPPPPGWDAAYSFDVIEHVEDPFEFLGTLERLAKLVVVNLLEPLPESRTCTMSCRFRPWSSMPPRGGCAAIGSTTGVRTWLRTNPEVAVAEWSAARGLQEAA